MSLDGLAVGGLLDLYGRTLDELRRREVLRSTNNPVADYAEYIVSRALGLQLVPKSTKGHDATDDRGRRYEIKGRRITPHNKSRQLSVIRGLDKGEFDFLAAVLFRDDFSVLLGLLIPHAVVLRHAVHRTHVNGWVLHARESLLDIRSVVDITKDIVAAAKRRGQ